MSAEKVSVSFGELPNEGNEVRQRRGDVAEVDDEALSDDWIDRVNQWKLSKRRFIDMGNSRC
ncbi:MAG: hypothetical protein QF918_09865 [Pirellulaceae bacterium]|nr:hypothetical protein [Pirellulaceae bacterium]MDP6554568.1 hypothetical protein [Pirellulaceae bacterium]